MHTRTKLFVLGSVIAMLSLGAGALAERHYRIQVAGLRSQCETLAHQVLNVPAWREDGDVVCDPYRLPSAYRLGAGVQKELVEAYRQGDDWTRFSYSVAGFSFFLLAIPLFAHLAWRFLLNRIRELSGAIRGERAD